MPVNKSANEINIADPSDGSCYWHSERELGNVRIIDLNPSSSVLDNTNGNYSVSVADMQLLNMKQHFVMDMNSDGKADILVINNDKSYKILSFKQNVSSPWAELEVLGQGFLPDYSSAKQILFGDYNGDSKPDIMIPVSDGDCWVAAELINGQPVLTEPCYNNDKWTVYYNNPNPNGGEYFDKQIYPIVEYRPSTKEHYKSQTQTSSYFAIDVNNDGKSDVVRVYTNVYYPNPFWDGEDIDSSWSVNVYTNNIGLNGGFDYTYSSPTQHENEDNSRPITIASDFRDLIKGIDGQILIIRHHPYNAFDKTITYVDFKKDINYDNLLKNVKQSNNNLVDTIEYESMVASTGNGFYSANELLEYPYVEIKQMKSNYLVKSISNSTVGITKTQNFKYHNFAVNVKGEGIIGFSKTYRSSWFSGLTDPRVWTVSENDPTLRGATIKQYSVLLNSNNFDNNESTYTTANGLISKNQNTFSSILDPISKRFTILLNTQTNTDYLTNVKTEKIYNQYSPDYFLPLSVTNKNYLGDVLQGETTITTDFETAIDTPTSYIVGKPKEINTIATIYVNTVGASNTKTSNEKLYYSNNNITKIEKKANGSAEAMVEDYTYFPNGLVQTKTISASGTSTLTAVAPRTTEYTYDVTNRFVKTTKDIQGLISTNNTYHPIYGTVLSQTNPFGQTTTNIIDNWGKRTKITDFLGKSITYNYNRTAGVYKTTEIGDDGSESTMEQDVLAREVRKGAKDLNGNWNYVKTEYDNLGRKLKTSEPYSSAESPSLWTSYEYDNYSRPIKVTAHTGKVVTTTYNGLIVTANEPTMTKSKTTNANGHLVLATDTPGGNITYKYDASGNMLESDYDGIKMTITYDTWGRKTSLVDTSAGTYTYNYDAFSQVKTETTPKGNTTYTYDDFGRVLTKSIQGNTAADVTNIVSTYSYDSTNKWLINIAVVNPNDGNNNYAYTYDTVTKQLKKTIETLYPVGSTTPIATFTKEINTFDLFGRVDTETSTATAFNKTSTKTLKHVYKNGLEWQLLDGTSVKWQANTVNERGQLTNATLGNGITITNSYNNLGYLTQNKHDKTGTTPVNIMTLNTVFEPVLGNLTSRYNSIFDVKEEFKYDNLDRLISWDGTPQTILNLPFNTTTDGFTFTGTSTQGSVTNSAGTLKVVLKSPSDPDLFPIAAQKNLALGLITGNKIRVKANITNKIGSFGVIVSAVMVETDPLDSNNYAEFVIGNIENGTFDSNYTVSDFVNNPTLKIKFIVSPDSPQTSNGGGNIISNSTFYIDNLKIEKLVVNTQNYDDRGRITQNNLGTYNYDNASNKPYQNNKINLVPDANAYYNARPTQFITYNAFKAPIKIEQDGVGADKISFAYNGMEERSIMYWGNTNDNKLARPYRRYYSADGSMEIKATFGAGSTTVPTGVEFLTYLDGDAYGSSIVLKSDGTTQNYFYLHRDYQGSILAITNATGVVVEKRLFDAWGAIAKVQDGAGNNLTKLTFFDRGYTGHEHLESVGLINMNARLYDPKLHRFLQADNFIQDINNTQNYNRYGYCFNNPLKYTDPSGNFIQLGVAVIIAVAVALTTHIIQVSKNHQHLTFGGVMTTVSIAAFSSYATFGIGEMVGTIGNFYQQTAVQAVAHGILQGGLTAIQGGKFWSGFASGAISSIVSSAWLGNSSHQGASGAFGLKNAKGITLGGTMFFGTISGGAGAALTGGNFWQGAVTGLVVSGLNHVMHQLQNRATLSKILIEKGVDPSAIPNMTTAELYSLAEKVFPEMYAESGCNELKIDPNMEDYGRTDSKDVINKKTGKMISTTTVSITFGPSSFKNFLQLASTMGHEFTHAIHNISGDYMGWFNSKGGGYAYNKTEILAHEWQINMSAPVNMRVYNSHLKWMSDRGF